MTFWELNLVFLGISAAALLVAVLARRVRGRHVLSIVLSTLILWVLTAVFDNIMIASGLFDYGGHALSGVFIGLAPLEDFAHPPGARPRHPRASPPPPPPPPPPPDHDHDGCRSARRVPVSGVHVFGGVHGFGEVTLCSR